MSLTEQERHNIEHMRYLTERATDEQSEVCFDYTLTKSVLEVIDRQRNAVIEECAVVIETFPKDFWGYTQTEVVAAIRALKDEAK